MEPKPSKERACGTGRPMIDIIGVALLFSRCAPRSFKTAVMKPLLKKPNLIYLVTGALQTFHFYLKFHRDVLSSSCLSSHSPVTLMRHFSLAFRQTAFVRVMNDGLFSSDCANVSVIMLLRLRVNSDIINHRFFFWPCADHLWVVYVLCSSGFP